LIDATAVPLRTTIAIFAVQVRKAIDIHRAAAAIAGEVGVGLGRALPAGRRRRAFRRIGRVDCVGTVETAGAALAAVQGILATVRIRSTAAAVTNLGICVHARIAVPLGGRLRDVAARGGSRVDRARTGLVRARARRVTRLARRHVFARAVRVAKAAAAIALRAVAVEPRIARPALRRGRADAVVVGVERRAIEHARAAAQGTKVAGVGFCARAIDVDGAAPTVTLAVAVSSRFARPIRGLDAVRVVVGRDVGGTRRVAATAEERANVAASDAVVPAIGIEDATTAVARLAVAILGPLTRPCRRYVDVGAARTRSTARGLETASAGARGHARVTAVSSKPVRSASRDRSARAGTARARPRLRHAARRAACPTASSASAAGSRSCFTALAARAGQQRRFARARRRNARRGRSPGAAEEHPYHGACDREPSAVQHALCIMPAEIRLQLWLTQIALTLECLRPRVRISSSGGSFRME